MVIVEVEDWHADCRVAARGNALEIDKNDRIYGGQLFLNMMFRERHRRWPLQKEGLKVQILEGVHAQSLAQIARKTEIHDRAGGRPACQVRAFG